MRSWESARPPEEVERGSDSQERTDQQDMPECDHDELRKDECGRYPKRRG